MRIPTSCDVLVVGAGIAGLTAAVAAARAGAQVVVASAGPLFSGASFFPGTWGLGCIAPEDDADAEDLIATILNVGGGVADPALVRTLVEGIRPALAWLERDMGVELMKPSEEAAGERAYIPCFDHKNRLWRGLRHDEFEDAFSVALERLGVGLLPGRELLDVLEGPEGVAGAVLYNIASRKIQRISCGSVVLATGGVAGLFERSLLPRDVAASAQGIAFSHGCELVNAEFIQIMPGLVHPCSGVVFNEKTFRYIVPERPFAADVDEQARLLELRSGHGPYTSRLASRAVDEAIAAAGPEGFALRYEMPEDDVPELVRTFSAWLSERFGVAGDDTLRIALYAHAANGGIRIDGQGGTGLPGLFACGEATGGMHGADRIGGLASANALVFGLRAGRAAAEAAVGQALLPVDGLPDNLPSAGVSARTAAALLKRVRRAMTEHAMVGRTDEGLSIALQVVEEATAELRRGELTGDAARAATATLGNQLRLARHMLEAMRARTVSLGSHSRG